MLRDIWRKRGGTAEEWEWEDPTDGKQEPANEKHLEESKAGEKHLQDEEDNERRFTGRTKEREALIRNDQGEISRGRSN